MALLLQFVQLSHEKKWTLNFLVMNEPHIHFRGTSFSHYIAINSAGCGLYLVCSWSGPRDMRLLTHDSSLIFMLAPHYICPKTNLFLSQNETSSPNHGIRQRGMWELMPQISLGERMDIFGLTVCDFSGWFLKWWQLQVVKELHTIRSDWALEVRITALLSHFKRRTIPRRIKSKKKQLKKHTFCFFHCMFDEVSLAVLSDQFGCAAEWDQPPSVCSGNWWHPPLFGVTAT